MHREAQSPDSYRDTEEENAYTVVVADGSFPAHDIPLGYLRNAKRVICCDGSAGNLVNAGIEPDAIVGDMDSLTEELSLKFADRIFRDENQDTNDLTKVISWCRERGYDNLIILGATGKREDHTIGNISLLTEYAKDMNVTMVTDTGIMRPYLNDCKIHSFPCQQVSIFSIDPQTEITSHGLKYPLSSTKITNWWFATLNEAIGDSFSLEFKGRLIVYLKFE